MTLPAKRYIATCAVCNGLFGSLRKDALTCSPACRTRGHRTGRITVLDAWVRAAAGEDVPLSLFLRVQAVQSLLPERSREVAQGLIELDAPELRAEMSAAFEALELRAVQRACKGDL